MNGPTIELWEGIGFGVIISFPSGVRYSNQTAGTACFHPSLEGVYVPLANDYDFANGRLLSPDVALHDYFAGPPHRGSGAWREGLDEKDATFIEGVLEHRRLSSFLKIDRARLAESHEAWVWGIVTGEEADSVFSGFGPYPRAAVLTWDNTD